MSGLLPSAPAQTACASFLRGSVQIGTSSPSARYRRRNLLGNRLIQASFVRTSRCPKIGSDMPCLYRCLIHLNGIYIPVPLSKLGLPVAFQARIAFDASAGLCGQLPPCAELFSTQKVAPAAEKCSWFCGSSSL